MSWTKQAGHATSRRRGGSAVARVRAGAHGARTRVEELREHARRERGVHVSETITVRGPAASETEARVAEVLLGAGCSQAALGPGRFRFARAVRPATVAVGGTAATIATLGVALPSLLFRRTEECAVTIEESPLGAQVTIVGRVPTAAMALLRSELGAPRWAATIGSPASARAGDATVAVQRPSAVPQMEEGTVLRERPAAPPLDHTVASARAAGGAPPPTGPPLVDDRTVGDRTVGARPAGAGDDGPHTMARPRATPVSRPVSFEEPQRNGGGVLELDTGDRVAVRGAVVVGRNPSATFGTPVVLVDRDRTISKSHFRILVEPDGVWVEDLSSTNGTTLVLPDGRSAAVRPGRRYPLSVNCFIRFGDRQARFVAD